MPRSGKQSSLKNKYLLAPLTIFLLIAFLLLFLFFIRYGRSPSDLANQAVPFVPSPTPSITVSLRSLDRITPERFSTANFVDQVQILEPQEPPKDWETIEPESSLFSISYPKNVRAEADKNSVGFCLRKECHDKFPLIQQEDRSIAEIVERSVYCDKYGTCFGSKVSIAPFQFGPHKGLVVLADNLLPEEVAKGNMPFPPMDGSGGFYLEVGDTVFTVYADRSDPLQKQILSTLKFK